MKWKRVVLILFFQIMFGYAQVNPKIRKAICEVSCKIQEQANGCQCSNVSEIDWQPQNQAYIPKLLCRSDDMISLRWNLPDKIGFAYFAEIKTQGGGGWSYPSQNYKRETLSVRNLLNNTSYQIRTWTVLTNATVLGPTTLSWIKTAPNNVSSLPIDEENIRINKFIYSRETCATMLEWIPAEDLSCYYSFIWYDDFGMIQERDINDPSMLFQIKVDTLNYNHNYTVLITAKQSNQWNTESPPTCYNITTPSCLEVHANLSICAPAIPQNLSVEYDVVPTANNSRFNFIISWSKPVLLPNFYTVTFSPFHENSTHLKANVSGEYTEVNFTNVEVRHLYYVTVKAYSVAGWSEVAEYSGEIDYTTHYIRTKSFTSLTVTITAGVLCVVFLSIAIGLTICHQRAKQRRDEKRSRYCLELEETVPSSIKTIIADYAMQGYVPDKWEIDSGDIVLQNILGEGAFGVVRHGWIKKGDARIEVAIKMLKSSPTVEELRHFHQEIEIMKSVGTHPHLVSLIGCCIKSDMGPLLVVEFCSRGDLQTYLRNIWEKLSNRSLILRCLSKISDEDSQRNGKEFVNKMYDIDAINQPEESELGPRDLISFARQIAMGMEYLSSLRVLHRDLAARNVLLCEDKTVKVSDFGLSRDVYKDNIYCKTAGGKLPVRWMALESLTHQRYTTQSDVWSFGILLWEVMNLGASPYPGIATDTLIKLLKSGYRMERPANCHQEIFTIMTNCWKAAPKDRPTFTEIRKSLEALLESETEYLHLDADACIEMGPVDFKKPSGLPPRSVTSERYVKTVPSSK